MPTFRTTRGYSLFELAATTALAATLLLLGVPALTAWTADNRLRTDVDSLFHAIHLARKESIVRRRAVSLCPSTDGSVCSNAWGTGWMLFVNIDRDWPAVRDPGEPVLRIGTFHAENRITANRPSFTLRSTELRATNGTVVFCDPAGHGRSRALVISYTGRPRVAYENSRGQPYSCAD